MKVLFPDGNLIDMATAAQVSYDPAVPSVTVFVQGYAGAYVYTAFSAFEMMTFHNIIQSVSKDGNGTVILPSAAAVPTAGNVTILTDTGGNIAVAGGNMILMTIPVATPMVESFLPENTVSINGKRATAMAWVSGFACMVQAPPNPAGTYSVIYYDRRGTFTKASVTYA